MKKKNSTALHIIVCIKSVVVAPPGKKQARTGDNMIFNPFDRVALQWAVDLKATFPEIKITAVSMGPPSGDQALWEALAMGADRGVLITDPALKGCDTLITARVLARAIGVVGPWDMLVFGERSADGDTAHVGPQTSVILDLPFVSGLTELEFIDPDSMDGDCMDGGVRVTRQMAGFSELMEGTLPLALSVAPKAGKVRDIPLNRIDAVWEEKSIEYLGLEALGLKPGEVGEKASPTKLLKTSLVKKSGSCRMIEGTADQQAEALIKELKQSGRI